MRHGFSKTKEYYAWDGMKQRCYNPKNSSYKYYGKKGIILDMRWKNNFLNFLEDMGIAPEGHSIHRIDSNGNYTSVNCIWMERGFHSVIHSRKQG